MKILYRHYTCIVPLADFYFAILVVAMFSVHAFVFLCLQKIIKHVIGHFGLKGPSGPKSGILGKANMFGWLFGEVFAKVMEASRNYVDQCIER